jgi:hypothetical protein
MPTWLIIVLVVAALGVVIMLLRKKKHHMSAPVAMVKTGGSKKSRWRRALGSGVKLGSMVNPGFAGAVNVAGRAGISV